jgi:hypothetical protein
MTLKKRIFWFSFFSTIVIFLNGCCLFCFYNVNEWKDDNPGLFTLAVHSLLGVQGNEDDTLIILETDGYGRVLFSYQTETIWTSDKGTFGWLIAQKADEEKVFFYPNVCFVQVDAEEDLLGSQKDTLKEENDWGEPLDDNQMDWLPVSRLKISTSLSKANGIILDAYGSHIQEEGMEDTPQWQLQTVDHEGRELFIIFDLSYDEENEELVWGRMFFLILQSDGSYDPDTFFVEITDRLNFQTDLAELKMENEWNSPNN